MDYPQNRVRDTYILLWAFFGTVQASTNMATLIIWSIWWVLLPFSFFLFGRIWCEVCPLAKAGDLLQGCLKKGRKYPGAFFRRYGIWITIVLFVLLTWFDRLSSFASSPRSTGMLLMVLLLGTPISMFFFQRRTWCRYLCPIGGLSEQISYVGGNCEDTLTICNCPTAQKMKGAVRLARQELKTQKEILNFFFDRHGIGAIPGKVALAKAGLSSGTPNPVIQVDPGSFDLGTIPQEIVTHSFTVKNKEDKDLVIAKITTSCGCTTAKTDKNIIPPGQDAPLTVTFDPLVHDTKGEATRTVSLHTNDPLTPVKGIKIKASVTKKKETAAELPSFAYNSAQTMEGYRISTQVPEVLVDGVH